MEVYTLSKQDMFNPVLEVTIVLLTPDYLQVFDGKGCFVFIQRLFWFIFTKKLPILLLKRNTQVWALKLEKNP